MDENKETVEDVKVEGTGDTVTQTEEKNEGEAEKTLTQSEVNALLKKEKEKWQKKMPSAERLKALQDFEESQKTAEQKQAEKEAEYQAKDNEISELQKENAVLKAGVRDSDDIDYILFKVSKMDGEFNENLAKFLEDNPKYIKGQELVEAKATGAPVKAIDSTEEDGVLAILKKKYPNIKI